MSSADASQQPFSFLTDFPAEAIARTLAKETGTVAGLVLSQAKPALLAKVLANMNRERQREVVSGIRKARGIQPARLSRLATSIHEKLQQVSQSPEQRRDGSRQSTELQAWKPRKDNSAQPINASKPAAGTNKDQALQKALALAREKSASPTCHETCAKPTDNVKKINGLAVAAEILRMAPAAVRNNISSHEPRLYQALRSRMFVFEDLAKSSDSTLAEIFTMVNPHTAALALRFAMPKLATRALMAISGNRSELVKDEMDLTISSSQRVRVRDIENAQQQVLEIALKLQRAGRIVIDPDEPEIVANGE